MKTNHLPTAVNPLPRRRAAGFTLMEMMIATGIFLGVFVGVLVGLQLFGLKVYTLAATKLSATDDARKTMNILRGQIRESKLVYVGNYSSGTFNRIANGDLQMGNALEMFFPDTNNNAGTNPLVYYQQVTGTADKLTNALYSVSNNVVTRMANYVTNNIVFTAEDYQASILTTYDNNPVIRVVLQFHEWQYPIGFIGTNGLNAYNHYRLQTRIARRTKQ